MNITNSLQNMEMFEKNNNNIMILKLAENCKRVSVFQDFFFSGHHGVACGILFPQPGIKPCPLHQKQSLPLDPQGNLQDFSLTNAPHFFSPNDQLFCVSQDNFYFLSCRKPLKTYLLEGKETQVPQCSSQHCL